MDETPITLAQFGQYAAEALLLGLLTPVIIGGVIVAFAVIVNTIGEVWDWMKQKISRIHSRLRSWRGNV